MKIGVAFSGSGAGAAASHAFADELQSCSLKIKMLSVTSLAAIPSLLWSRGLPCDEIGRLMKQYQAAQTSCKGLQLIRKTGIMNEKATCDLAVNCVDTLTGVTVIYCDSICSDAWNLKVEPLQSNEYAALCATVSPYRACKPYANKGMNLCDFSVRYGCPYFPLKMAGMERLLSVSFAGGDTPAQIASDSISVITGKNAQLHYTVKCEGDEDPEQQVRRFVQEHIEEIYDKMLLS